MYVCYFGLLRDLENEIFSCFLGIQTESRELPYYLIDVYAYLLVEAVWDWIECHNFEKF